MDTNFAVFQLLLATVISFAAIVQLRGDEQNGSKTDELTAYVGTYTHGKSEGIYVLRLSVEGDKLTSKSALAAKIGSPSFVAISGDGKHVYCVNETDKFKEQNSGAVSAFAVNDDGALKLLNQQPSGGGGPCHLVIDKSGKHVLVANYGGGSVASLPIAPDGSLGPPTSTIKHEGSSVNPDRQKEPHAHSINVDPGNRFAAAADLGLDKVLVYKFDAKTGKLSANEPPSASVKAGAGPRHFAFHPDGKFAYVINELQMTATAFDYDAERGVLKPMQTISTLPPGEESASGYSTAEIQVHPSGKFVYGSNRGHHTIAIFSVDEKTGKLTHVANEPIRGKTPRNFGIDPSGKYLLACGQDSDTVAVFRIDATSGKLTLVGEPISVPTPVCVKFMQ